MEKIVLSLVFIAVAGSASMAQNATDVVQPPSVHNTTVNKSLALGESLPNANMMGTDGRMISLAEAKTEKGLLVMFSCNTCPYVLKARKQTAKAIAEAKSLGIGMIIINSNQAQRANEDNPEAMKKFAATENYTVPYVIDENSQAADIFGATRTPEVYLFDGGGKLVYKGALEDNPANPEKSTKFYAVDAMHAMSDRKAIKLAETKSIGCSIKRM